MIRNNIIEVKIGKRRIITYKNQNVNGEVFIRPIITLTNK